MDQLRPEDSFDFKSPDYVSIFRARAERLNRLRAKPELLPGIKAYYRNHIADFISDWGCTYDPRNVEVNLPALLPMILFPKQREMIEYMLAHWRGRARGLIEKSRDIGATTVATAVAASLCLFHDGMAVGFGSRKVEYVDNGSDPKSIFGKIRTFLELLPMEFRGGWDRDCAPKNRCDFPDTKSFIGGESGDEIGRGNRTSLFFVDEAAHLEHPLTTEHALSATTNCRIDMSSVNGMANEFARMRHEGKIEVFTYHWRDDPRKSPEWAEKKKAELSPVTWAQEYELDYLASVEGQVIPAEISAACIDAHLKLSIRMTGEKVGAWDFADEGRDKNAFVIRRGILITHVESWSGKRSDMVESTYRVFDLCETHGVSEFHYDADGMGANIKAAARVCNESWDERYGRTLTATPYRGSAAVHDPEKRAPGTDRKNEDYFANAKAQAWFNLRRLFQNTYNAIQDAKRGVKSNYDPDELISIASTCPNKDSLLVQLSQATYAMNTAGKIVIDKNPDDAASPDQADAAVIAFAPRRGAFRIDPALLAESARRVGAR